MIAVGFITPDFKTYDDKQLLKIYKIGQKHTFPHSSQLQPPSSLHHQRLDPRQQLLPLELRLEKAHKVHEIFSKIQHSNSPHSPGSIVPKWLPGHMVAAARKSQFLVWLPSLAGTVVHFSVLFHYQCANWCSN